MDMKKAHHFPFFIPKFRIASDQRVNLFHEMKGKGTPKKRRILFLRFMELSGRTIFELRTFRIEYVDSTCPQCLLAKDMNALHLHWQRYKIKMRRQEYGFSFYEKSLFYP